MKPNIQVYPVEKSPGRLITKTFRLMRLGMTRLFAARGFNLTTEHWAVINVLWQEDGQPQNQLAERAFKDGPNISRIVDQLAKNGFVRRRADARDRRRQRVFLTGAGRSLRPELSFLVLEFFERAFEGVSPKEYETLFLTLEKISANIENLEADQGGPRTPGR